MSGIDVDLTTPDPNGGGGGAGGGGGGGGSGGTGPRTLEGGPGCAIAASPSLAFGWLPILALALALLFVRRRT